MISIIYDLVIFLFLTNLNLIFLLNITSEKRKKRKKRKKEKKLYYYFFVPCVNEEKVIYKTIKSLLKIKRDAHVIAINDGSTDSTLSIMRRFPKSRCTIINRKPPNARVGKGLALNQALLYCLKDVKKKKISFNRVIIGVIDADGKLSKNAIKELNRAFYPDNVSAAQLRVKMYSKFSNTLQVAQDAEFFTINNLIQNARVRTNSVGLSGNGQFFRLKPIIDTIGFEPWGTSLLDDYELTLKLMMNKLKIAYVSNAFVYQEALASTSLFIKQRSRWVQGNLECLKYVKPTIKSNSLSNIQKISVLFFLSQPFINLIGNICVLIYAKISITYIWVNIAHSDMNDWFVYLVLFFVSISIGTGFTILYYKNLKRYKEKKPSNILFIFLPFVISYLYIILFFSVVIAFIRQLSNQHSWIKTKRN
ncbi:glycosyltransferase [Vagococcus sp. JNUCC 83]